MSVIAYLRACFRCLFLILYLCFNFYHLFRLPPLHKGCRTVVQPCYQSDFCISRRDFSCPVCLFRHGLHIFCFVTMYQALIINPPALSPSLPRVAFLSIPVSSVPAVYFGTRIFVCHIHVAVHEAFPFHLSFLGLSVSDEESRCVSACACSVFAT